VNINNNTGTTSLEALASSLDPQDKENFAAAYTNALAHDMFLDGNANKIVGGHLLITKRNSNNTSTEEQQQQLYNHQLLTNTTSLLAQQYQNSKMTPNDQFNEGAFFPASVMASLHKRLDRSQSEPVWQQEQLQPVSTRNFY